MSSFTTIIIENAVYICFALIWTAHFFTTLSYSRFARIIYKKGNKASYGNEPVSVVIVAHNQADKLQRNLPYILEQDYEDFEVVVVNDASTDDTEDVLKHLELRYNNLRHTFTPMGARHVSHKRLALTIGIKAALNDLILFVEPDSRPSSDRWIKMMSQAVRPQTQIVLGYANHKAEKDRLNRKTRFFNLYHQLHYLTWTFKHKAYRCHPANVAYRKSFFMSHKGFADDVKLADGAIELLVNRHSTRHNTECVISPQAVMLYENYDTPYNWHLARTYYYETRRHFKNVCLYRTCFILKQCLLHLFYPTTVFAVTWSILQEQWIATGIVSALFLILLVCKTLLFNRSCKAMNEQSCHFSFLWYESRIIWWELTSWFRHYRCPKHIFYRKA